MSEKSSKLSHMLKRLLFERDMRQADLSRELGISLPTIHRIVTGKSTRPHQSSLEAMAKYFNVSVPMLTGEEEIFPSSVEAIKSPIIRQNAKVVPLVRWEDLEFVNNIKTCDDELVVIDVSDKAFAVTMPDYSMEPAFGKGSTLIFDPAKPCADRSYVLIKLHTANLYVVRQLLVDVEHKFVKSLNPDISTNSLRLLTPDDEIIARIVEIRNIL